MHLLIQNGGYSSHSYGMLRCLENEILAQTNAQKLVLKLPPLWEKIDKTFPRGTRFAKYRKYFPKCSLKLPTTSTTLWHVLMGPEDYKLDLCKGWNQSKESVLYLFDTFPSQVKRIKDLFCHKKWKTAITSFNDALPILNATNTCNWHHIDQAVSVKYFYHVPIEQKSIAFSSYGRRHPRLHEALLRFCGEKRIYYDYTTHSLSPTNTDPLELFQQYAWHLSHSLFTVCWPVELTHPKRAGGISPITCRWFEAAAASAVVLGLPPKNPYFSEIFPKDMVHEVNPNAEMSSILMRLEELWSQRTRLSLRAERLRKDMKCKLDWSDRVIKMIKLAETI